MDVVDRIKILVGDADCWLWHLGCEQGSVKIPGFDLVGMRLCGI